MASPSVGQDGARPQGLEVSIVAASGGSNGHLGHGEAPGRGAATAALSSVSAPVDRAGWPEEVAVCELCGLVSRLPRAAVCPACGGGYG